MSKIERVSIGEVAEDREISPTPCSMLKRVVELETGVKVETASELAATMGKVKMPVGRFMALMGVARIEEDVKKPIRRAINGDIITPLSSNMNTLELYRQPRREGVPQPKKSKFPAAIVRFFKSIATLVGPIPPGIGV